ncbi:MAG: hypothetical protein AMXMBFR84_08060 [Candidatus Hydrogenedentota bacterium]
MEQNHGLGALLCKLGVACDGRWEAMAEASERRDRDENKLPAPHLPRSGELNSAD